MKRNPQSVGVLAAATVVALGLASCAPAGDSGGPTGEKPSGTLNIITSSAAGSDAGFELINKAFEAAYPDVKVEYTTVQNSDYDTVLSTRMTAGNVDVVSLNASSISTIPEWVTNGSATTNQLAAANGQFLNLAAEPFMAQVNPSIVDAVTQTGGEVYGFPLGLSYYTGTFYNKALFKELGIEVPTTWSEFVAAADKIKASGVTPLGIGGKDGWPAQLPMAAAIQSSFPSYEDRVALDRGLWEGTVSLTDPDMVKVLTLTEQFWNYAQENFAGVAYSETPGMFARGEVAMTPDGIWNQPVIDSAVAGKFEYGYFPIPFSEKPQDNAYLGGKVDLALGIISGSKNLSAAKAYVAFIADPANYAKFVEKAGFAPIEDVATSDFLQSIAPYTKVFSPAWDQVFHANADAGPAASGAFNGYALRPLGTLSPEEAAAAAQADWLAGKP